MCLLFTIYFFLDFWIVFFTFRLFQVHSEIIEFFRCWCQIRCAKFFLIFLEKVIRASILQQIRWWFILIFAAWWFYRKVTSFFGFYQFNIFIFDINDCWLLILSKEIVLFLIFYSSKRLNRAVIKIDRTEISIAFVSCFEMFF